MFKGALILTLLLHCITVRSACIEYTLNIQNVTCFGGSDGSIHIAITNGSGPFVYNWNPNITTLGTATQLTARNYTFNIIDSSNCSVSQNVQLFESQTRISLYVQDTPISCSGKRNGMLSVYALGGSPPYTFNLSSGEQSSPTTSYTFRNLPLTQLTQPPLVIYDDELRPPFYDKTETTNYKYSYLQHSGTYAIAMYPTHKHDGLIFQCDGCIDFDTYSGVSFWINGISGGQIIHSAIDDGNENLYSFQNVVNKDFPLAQLPPDTWIQVFYNFSTTNFPYTRAYGFRIQDVSEVPGSSVIVVDDISLVPKFLRDQLVTVTDTRGCVAQQTYEIGVAPAMYVNVNVTNPACYDSEGTLQANITNGSPPYTYLWLPSYNTSQTAFAKGTMHYNGEYIFDDSLIGFVDLSTPDAVQYNNRDVVYRGSTSFSYSPPNNESFVLWYRNYGVEKSKYQGIEFWMYSKVNITEELHMPIGMGRYNKEDMTITYPQRKGLRLLTQLHIIPAHTWVKGFYSFDTLRIDVLYNAFFIRSMSMELGPVYLDEIRLILASDNKYEFARVDSYKLIVTDSNFCSASLDHITLQEPEKLTVEVTAYPASCHRSQDDNLTVVAKGGTMPYTYMYNMSGEIRNHSIHSVVRLQAYAEVTDAARCTVVSEKLWMGSPPDIYYSYSSSPVSCRGGEDGQITLTASGGVPPFSLSFSSKDFASHYISKLPVYIYADDVSDMFGRTIFLDDAIRKDDSIDAQSGYYSVKIPNFYPIKFSCDKCMDPNEYEAVTFWFFVPKSETLPNIITVDLLCGLDGMDFSSVLTNASRKVWHKITYEIPANANSTSDFLIMVGVYSDSPREERVYLDTIQLVPKWYSNHPRVHDLPANFEATFVGKSGLYTIGIADANGCSKTATFFIGQTDALELDVVAAQPPTLNNAHDGWIQINASGGTPPYKYTWHQPGGFGESANGLDEGIFNVTVQDRHECEFTLSIPLAKGPTLLGHNTIVTALLAIVVGLCIICALMALAMLMAKPKFYLEKSPLFCKFIHLGVLVGYVAAALAIPTPTDTLCILFPWLVGVSFTLVYGCLFLKTWRIFWIIRASKKMQRVILTNFYIVKLLSIAFAFEFIYLIIWTIADPPRAKLIDSDHGEKTMVCAGHHKNIYWSVFIAYKFLWVVFGVVMAVGSRKMIEKYNESKQIYYSIYNTVIFSIICLPLQAILEDIPYAQMCIIVVLLVIIFTFTLVALYFEIWMKIIFKHEDEFIAPRRATLPTISDSDGDNPHTTTPIAISLKASNNRSDIRTDDSPRSRACSSPVPLSELAEGSSPRI